MDPSVEGAPDSGERDTDLEPPGPGDGTGGDGGGTDGPDPERVRSGEALYGELCAGCHGPAGEGGAGLPLIRAWDRPTLVDVIDARMPTTDPNACVGECAELIADFIVARFTPTRAADCPAEVEAPPGPRVLRLLTRREYRNTVRDLFGDPDDGRGDASAAPACGGPADCDLTRASCIDGRCRADACETVTFVWDPRGEQHRSVHVAGSFNDWPGTVADGGWAMEWSEAAGVWFSKRALEDGRHTYKFVIDESRWEGDPLNPVGEDDGFGGRNSVLEHRCEGVEPPNEDGLGGGGLDLPDPTGAFPPESRPLGFAYETHAAAGQVTAVHAAVYIEGATDIAVAAMRNPAAWLGCDGGGGCVEALVGPFADRVFRRPVDEETRSRYRTQIAEAGEFREGATRALATMLASPFFLYRSEVGAPAGDGTYALDDWELASALSYGLWGTLPDAALFDAAASGALSEPAGLAAQADRMLADPRARDTVGVFAVQWLGVDAVDTLDKRGDLYPAWDEALARAVVDETRQFVAHAIFEGEGFADLLTADYTLAAGQLAALYELEADAGGVAGYRHGRRAGVLGHASVLSTYAHSDQTSPIRRGLFVRERLLCQDLGVPPPSAGGVPDVDPDATTRERFRQHTDDEFCAGCHKYIDPIGFGFERFDAIGAWREAEAGQAIDASGSMDDVEGLGTGTTAPFDTVPQLAGILAESDAARTCFARQYRRFNRGYEETGDDACAVDALARAMADGDVLAMMRAVVTSRSFRVRR